MLGIAYAASIGGVGTLIGTPPNVILKGYIELLAEASRSERSQPYSAGERK